MPMDPNQVPAQMQQQMPSPRGNAPEEKPESSPTDILGDLQKALFQTNEAVQGSSLPKEAQSHLANALTEYSAFTKIVGESMGVPMPEMGKEGMMGNQPSEMGGAKGAVPADMPMGRNVKAVPA